MNEFAWLVPVSSRNGIAHWMEYTEQHKWVKPACNYGQFNPAYAEIAHDKFCKKCLEAQIRGEG